MLAICNLLCFNAAVWTGLSVPIAIWHMSPIWIYVAIQWIKCGWDKQMFLNVWDTAQQKSHWKEDYALGHGQWGQFKLKKKKASQNKTGV